MFFCCRNPINCPLGERWCFFPLDWRDVPRADYLCFHRRQQKERLCVSAKGKLGHEKRRPLFLLCEGEITAWRPFYLRIKGAAGCFGGLAIRFINDYDKLLMCNSRKSARFAPLQELWFGHNSVNIHRHRMWRGNKWLHAYKLSSQWQQRQLHCHCFHAYALYVTPKPVKEVSFKKRNGYIGDYAPTGLKFNLNGLFLRVVQLSRPAVCIHSLKRRPRTHVVKKKGAHGDNIRGAWGGGTVLVGAHEGVRRLVFPPASLRLCARPSSWVQRGHAAGCSSAPPMNQMRQVQLRWITVIQPATACGSTTRPRCLL